MIITPDEEIYLSTHVGSYILEELQDIVNGPIELICCPNDTLQSGRRLAIVVNEEGRFLGLRDNDIAIAAASMLGIPVWSIVGTVLFIALDDQNDFKALSLQEREGLIGPDGILSEYRANLMRRMW